MPQFSLGKDISELFPWWFIPGVVSGLVHPTQSSRVSRCNVQFYVFAYNPQTLNRLWIFHFSVNRHFPFVSVFCCNAVYNVHSRCSRCLHQKDFKEEAQWRQARSLLVEAHKVMPGSKTLSWYRDIRYIFDGWGLNNDDDDNHNHNHNHNNNSSIALQPAWCLSPTKMGMTGAQFQVLKFKIGIFMYVSVCKYGLVFRVPTPPHPQCYGSPGNTPFQAIGSISEVQPRIC